MLGGAQSRLGLLAVGDGPGQLAASIAGSLIEPLAQPVPLRPQLRRRQPPQIWAAGGVDREGLAASSRQGLGQLQVAVGLLSVGQVQLPAALGLGADDRVQPGLLAGSGQLHIQPMNYLSLGCWVVCDHRRAAPAPMCLAATQQGVIATNRP
jgi:hypothetical protein